MRFKTKFILIFFLALISIGAGHKFYVSVTNFEYDEDEQSFQITSRIFIDDLETVLNTRYEVDARLTAENEISSADELIAKYLNTKITVKINGEERKLTYLGKEYRDDLVICYLEIPEVIRSDLSSIEVMNEVLTELFDEQQNVVHLKIGSKKKSFILVRENNKGMLNL